MKSKTLLLNILVASIVVLSFSCQSKTVEELAEKDSTEFLNNLDNSEKLSNHPMVLPVNMPVEIAEQNKSKSIERLQDYFAELCTSSKDIKLLNSYRQFGDDNQKILFLEYEFCTSGIVVMGYEVVDNDVTLFSVWPMKKAERPEVLFSEEQDW